VRLFFDLVSYFNLVVYCVCGHNVQMLAKNVLNSPYHIMLNISH
jgi:hypothetical protein